MVFSQKLNLSPFDLRFFNIFILHSVHTFENNGKNDPEFVLFSKKSKLNHMKWREETRRMKKAATKTLPSTAKQKLHATQHKNTLLVSPVCVRFFKRFSTSSLSSFSLLLLTSSSKKVIVYAGINREIKWLWKTNELQEKHTHTPNFVHEYSNEREMKSGYLLNNWFFIVPNS